MNIKQLKYVCAIVDSGSFSSAAAREGVSVQAVSKSMGELEGRLGAALFERTSAGVRPTAFGRAFAARARRVLEEWDALERFAAEGPRDDDETRPVRTGLVCPEFPGVERLSALIALLVRRALGREAEVSVLGGGRALDELRSGRVDALFTLGALHADDVVSGPLGTVSTCVLMSADHPLASRPKIALDELAPYPALVSRSSERFNDSILKAYLARGLRSRLVEVGSPEELRAHFAAGGFSFLAAGNLYAPLEGMVARELFKADEVAVPICLCTLRGSPAADYREFRQAIAAMNLLA